ncbi:hypothetical protein ACFVP8_19635 [Viridibacillus arvi]|uniref:L-arabinose isomerase family protein n=1 Tax=Viridibacillus arvi TaxID=263475 RepID=UPI0036B7249F
MKRVQYKKPRIGLYSTGLEAYWAQFPGLRERLLTYNCFIESNLAKSCDVANFGLVDTVQKARKAGDWFTEQQVDIIFVHAATYATSATVLPVHQHCSAKVILLNLQPSPQLNYDETNTAEWLANCGACPVPEFANALHRANIPYDVINGLLGLSETPVDTKSDENTSHMPEAQKAWKTINEWVQAAKIKRNLQQATFGFLGNTYSGMLDLYSDLTMLQAQTGIHIEVLEMCDLQALQDYVTTSDVAEIEQITQDMFNIAEDSPSEKLAKKPSKEQLAQAYNVAATQQKLVEERGLDALAYYYHGAPGNAYEQLQSDFILGHSLLTANGISCAGEGDLKTAVAMKVCDTIGVGGSFCEIVVTDYKEGAILFGHDGPFHIDIAEGKPALRGMGVYHGKQGSGISVEAKVKTGPITLLYLTQTVEGRLKWIISEAESTDGRIMTIGNTQTPVKFSLHPDEYFDALFKEAPTHHCAMAIGHNASVFTKMAKLMGTEYKVI